MRKTFLIAMFSCFGFLAANAQSTTEYFATAGFSNLSGKVEGGGMSTTITDSGFYAGFGAIFELAEKSSIFAELSYMNVDETNFIQLPVLFQYEFADKLSFLAGPQFVYVAEESIQDLTNFSVGLAGGLKYDISDKFFALARYMFQVTNTYTGSLDITARTNILNVGIGFKL